MRYIELNPVRADMVQDPAQYRWSSYRHNGLGQPDERITPHPLYPSLGQDSTSQQFAYRALFRSQMDDAAIADIRIALTQNQPLGSTKFSDTLCAAAGIRRAQTRRGRPATKTEQLNKPTIQPDFGF